MKIFIIECDAEELRANRTVLDSITEAVSSFTRAFAGVDASPDQVAQAINNLNNEETDEGNDEQG